MKKFLAFLVALVAAISMCVFFASCKDNVDIPMADNDYNYNIYSLTVGDQSPNFTLEVYDGNGLNGETFTLGNSLAEGKIVVLNFWKTTINACIYELPYLNRLKKEYGEEVEVLAIPSIDANNVQEFINTSSLRGEDWTTYEIIFAQDAKVIEYNEHKQTTYETFVGQDAYPITVIINSNGVFAYIWFGSMTYEILESAYLNVKNS